MSCCIVIPAYEPEEKMLPYLEALSKANVGPVLVVDDGSGPEFETIFARAQDVPGCTVLYHPQNRGKGAAIKTALAHYRENMEGCVGVVTADCDGQHSVADVARLCDVLETGRDALVLGSRDFGENTPQRSAMGNKATSVAMRLLYDIRLKDTQTGLRGIPNSRVPAMETLRGDRYEYELNMLIYAKQKCIPFALVPIETIYFDNNAGSHFRTVPDAARLVGQMLRGLLQYGFASALAGVVDVLVYTLMVKLALSGFPDFQRLFFAAAFARVLSSSVNYAFNRKMPYVQNSDVGSTIGKYYFLWLCQLLISFVAVWLLHTVTGVDEVVLKLVVDGLLGLLSYQVQMRWVFRNKEAVSEIRVGDMQEEEA